MKVMIILVLGFFISAKAKAETISLKSGEVYVGQEALNEKLTGNKCFIAVSSVAALAEKGLHCHKINFQYKSDRIDIPKDGLSVVSRYTNLHRPEFPKIKTCAVNVDGTTYGDEIYGEDTTLLYNQIFGGMHTSGGTQFDYFLTFSPDTKLPIRARIHVSDSQKEHDVDCVRLQRM